MCAFHTYDKLVFYFRGREEKKSYVRFTDNNFIRTRREKHKSFEMGTELYYWRIRKIWKSGSYEIGAKECDGSAVWGGVALSFGLEKVRKKEN